MQGPRAPEGRELLKEVDLKVWGARGTNYEDM